MLIFYCFYLLFLTYKIKKNVRCLKNSYSHKYGFSLWLECTENDDITYVGHSELAVIDINVQWILSDMTYVHD